MTAAPIVGPAAAESDPMDSLDESEEGERHINSDKKTVRRERKRKMMVSYRKEKKMEQTLIKETLKQLEGELQALVSASKNRRLGCASVSKVEDMLSWRDIAQALDDEVSSAHSKQRSLKLELESQTQLVRFMKEWVISNLSIAISPNPICPTWRNCTLMADPQTRQLGKEWITKQMYHNAARVFATHGFPTGPTFASDFYIADVEYTDEGNEYIMGWQFVSMTPVGHLTARFRTLMCDALMTNSFYPIGASTIHEASDNTLLHQMVSKTGDYVNMLVGQFDDATDEKSVLVVRQILHDDTRPDVRQQRNRSAWMEIAAAAPGEPTKVRIVLHASHRRTTAGPIPMQDEARMWGCDLTGVPPAHWEARLRRDLLRLMPTAFAKIRSTLAV
ncbi:Aste57867_16299 [Aphanomyces stellatus]|uniref:Aste57867_16299 protein n=1 Tax=Aphanomyces stellatus TaxID=120398 RepID=A0A485L5A4_9STRA|nr:hypothetical protein As57867_016242 [Aphanomyces stellatus]VFT93075.1 Aste57867_16299 [Aphanomyces stellatus]